MRPTQEAMLARLRRWGTTALCTVVATGLVAGSAAAAGTGDRREAGSPGPVPAAASPWGGNTPNPHGGTDYFVDASLGDDAAPGTSREQAWRSLDRVGETTFQPGDRVLLKGGETWQDQQLWPKGSGSADAPISIDAYGDPAAGLPFIATNGEVPSPFDELGNKNVDTVGLTGAVVLRNQAYWHIANLELSNDDDVTTDITTGSVVRDGVSISINADLLPPGAETIMRGFRIHDLVVRDIDGPSTWQRIHYGGVNFQVFGERQYQEYPTGGHYFQDVRIENNSFYDVELHAIQFAFNWFGAQQGQTDATGKFHEGWEQLWVRDRDLYSRDVYIGHNYAQDIGQGPYQFANTKDMLVEYNEANGWLQRYSQVSAGLYLWAGADTVMRFNEVYGGPAAQYDATPWDLEYTNFDVTYEWNYSHDNAGGWMAYMGNSSNSIARYNLSVNDNGVLWKNMLSTNYSPTYVTNNVFVYDGAELDAFHDERLLSPVYFLNNVFYNTSTTDSTTWATRSGGLDLGVFSHNAFYEASGVYSEDQPADAHQVRGDPGFVGDPADYARSAGVENVRDSAALFQLRPGSPLVDAGRYNPSVGQQDFFGTDLYWGEGMDIGLHEVQQGDRVVDPVDTDPIEEEGRDLRPDLALNRPVVASSTHPHANFSLRAENLVDGGLGTRWAAADDAAYPITVDIDLQQEATVSEVRMGEYVDGGTDPRVADWDLQRWDPATEAWVTFTSGRGIGTDLVVTEFGEVVTSRLRLVIEGILPGQTWAPTMTRISVYGPGAVQGQPTVTPTAGLYDVNPAVAGSENNVVTFTVDPDGDSVAALRYVTTSGAVVGSLGEDDYTVTTEDGLSVYRLTAAFAADKQLGGSAVDVSFASGTTIRVTVEIVDTTELESVVDRARAVAPGDGEADVVLAQRLAEAERVLAAANRAVPGTGNTGTTQAEIVRTTQALAAAVEAVPAPDARPTLVADREVVHPGQRLTLTARAPSMQGGTFFLESPGHQTRRAAVLADGTSFAVPGLRPGTRTFTVRWVSQDRQQELVSDPVVVTVRSGPAAGGVPR